MHTRDWLYYFEGNAPRRLRPPTEPYRLSADERKRIEASIQGFQLGEASEGHHLRESAESFARWTGNTDYPRAIACLIREENRHSAYLGHFMRQQGLAFARSKWSDRVFRALRRLAGIEQSLRVLVTAELVALTYYDCLADATESPTLRLICRRMLEEEAKHVEFQMHHVHWINLQKPFWRAAAANVVHALLTAGTLLVVWAEHRAVLTAKHHFRGFFGRVWSDFLRTMHAGAASALETLDNPEQAPAPLKEARIA
jgi:hypothetical protein